MLDTKAFVRWANEHVIPLFAHNELGHDPLEEEEEDGEVVERCPLYPGLTCRDHVRIAVAVDTGLRGEVPEVPFLELCPNTWLVLPTGEVQPIDEEDQFVAARIRERVAEVQETLGAAEDAATFARASALLAAAEEAADEERWGEALVGLRDVEGLVTEVRAPLRALLEERLEPLEEDVRFTFEDIAEDEERSAAQRVEAVRALLRAVDVPVLESRLAVCESMEAWLAARDGRAR